MTQHPENEELSFEALVSRVDEDLAELSLESLAAFGEIPDLETSRRTTDVVQDVRGIEEFSGRLKRVVRCLELLELDRRRLVEHGVDGLTNSGDLRHQATLKPVQGQIGRFQILKELGAGGFGIVFLAEDPVLQRKVAIKIPKPECLVVPDLRERFLWESRLAAKLTHPNIVSIYEAGQDGAITFQVSEYCSGGTLAQFLQSQVHPGTGLRQRQLPVDAAAELLIRIADGIQYAHEHGILHRDLKPGNILLQPRGESASAVRVDGRLDDARVLWQEFHVRVSDFGLAKLMDMTLQERETAGWESHNKLSQTAMAGTPRYMAPEQIQPGFGSSQAGGGWTAATDVYALGAILYEVLCGVPVIRCSNEHELREAILRRNPATISSYRRDVPRDLEAICCKALSKKPGDRYATASQFADDLRAFRRGEPVTARPWSATETLVRFARRHPAISALLSMVAFLLLGLIGFGFWHVGRISVANSRLNQTVFALREQKKIADQERIAAERYSRVARAQEYSTSMILAGNLFHDRMLNRLSGVLQPYIPASQRSLLNRPEGDPRGFEWFYLWNQSHSELALRGSDGTPEETVITPDGKECFSYSRDNVVSRWDLQNGQLLSSQKLPWNGDLRSSCFSADGQRLAVSYHQREPDTGKVLVFSLHPFGLLLKREVHSSLIDNVRLTPDGAYAFIRRSYLNSAQNKENVLEVMEVESGRVVSVSSESMIPGMVADFSYETMTISADSKLLFVQAHTQNQTRIVSTEIAILTASFSDYSENVCVTPRWDPVTEFFPGEGIKVICSPDRRWLAAAYRDPNVVRVFDAATGQCKATIDSLPNFAEEICFHGSHRILVVHDMIDHESPLLGKVQVPPVKSVTTTLDLKGDSRSCIDDSVTSLAYHEPSGLTIAGRSGGQLTAMRNHRSKEHLVVPGHGPLEAWGVAFSTDGRRLYSVGDDSCLKVWDLPAGTLVASLNEHSTLVSCVAVSPDGRWIATGSYDNTVCLWDTSSLKLQYRFTGHTEALKTLVFSPRSQILASAGRGHHIRCWTVSDGRLIRVIPRYYSDVRGLAFLSETDLVEANVDGQLVLHRSTQPARLLHEIPHEVHSLALVDRASHESHLVDGILADQFALSEPCRKAILFGGKFGSVDALRLPHQFAENSVANFADSVSIPIQRFHGVDIRSIAVSADGRTIAVGGDDQAVHLISLQTGEELLAFSHLPAAVNQLAFSPDHRYLAAALHNGEIRVWVSRPGDE